MQTIFSGYLSGKYLFNQKFQTLRSFIVFFDEFCFDETMKWQVYAAFFCIFFVLFAFFCVACFQVPLCTLPLQPGVIRFSKSSGVFFCAGCGAFGGVNTEQRGGGEMHFAFHSHYCTVFIAHFFRIFQKCPFYAFFAHYFKFPSFLISLVFHICLPFCDLLLFLTLLISPKNFLRFPCYSFKFGTHHFCMFSGNFAFFFNFFALLSDFAQFLGIFCAFFRGPSILTQSAEFGPDN